VAVAPILLALIACRGLLGIEPLEPLPADAGVIVLPDAAAHDAARDVVRSDTSTDGGDAGDFCASLSPIPYFCADFDHGNNLKHGWDNATTNPDPGVAGGGSYEFTTNYWSSPRAAHFDIPELLNDNANASAALYKTLDGAPNYLEVDFEILIITEDDPPGGGGSEFLASIAYTNYAGAIVINRDANGTELAVFDGSNRTALVTLSTSIIVGTWAQLSILVQNQPVSVDGGAPGAGVVEVAVNGTFAATAPVPADVVAIPTPPVVIVGVSSAQGEANEFEMNVDNVVMVVTPRP
jgi:hypothetical protein